MSLPASRKRLGSAAIAAMLLALIIAMLSSRKSAKAG